MKSIYLASAIALVGCGTQNQKPTQTSVAHVDAPQAIVVRVPVNAQGQEMTDAVEVRSLTSNALSAESTSSAVSSAFAAGQSVEVKTDELDQDTSSQQFHGRVGWYLGTPWYPGKLLGRGLTWGANPYRYYANNGYYNYNSYGNSWYGNGCNYYVYRPCSGYSYGYGASNYGSCY